MCDIKLTDREDNLLGKYNLLLKKHANYMVYQQGRAPDLVKLPRNIVQCLAHLVIGETTESTIRNKRLRGVSNSPKHFSKELSVMKYSLLLLLRTGKVDTRLLTSKRVFTGYIGDPENNRRSMKLYEYFQRYIMPIVKSVILQHRQDVALALQSKRAVGGLPQDIAKKIAKMSMRKSPRKTSRRRSRKKSKRRSRKRSRPRRSR